MSLAFLNVLHHVLPDPLFIHDHAGRLRGVNEKACESLGYTRDDLLGMCVMDFECDFDLPAAQAVWSRIAPDETPIVFGHHRRRDGSVFPVEIRLGLLEAAGERLYFATARDITERLRTEERLRDSLAHIRTVFETMAEGLVVQDAAGAIVDANPAAERILGLTRDQLLGRSSIDPRWRCVHEDGRPFPGHEHPAMVALTTGAAVQDQIMGVEDPRTGLRWLSVNARPVFAAERGKAVEVVTTFVDVSSLRESYQRIRGLAQRLETVREEERCAIAERLNEGVAQDLYALKLALEYEAALEGGDADPLMARAEVMSALVRCIESTRDMANALRPATITHLPGSGAIRHHAAYFARISGLRITVEDAGPLPVLPEPTRLAMFRAVQEALTNVSKHARASRVHIVVRAAGAGAALEVADDGIGIGEDALRKPGTLGLLALRERLTALGGHLSIARRAPHGTVLTVELPL